MLLKNGLVTDNAQAGKMNGQRIAALAPGLTEPTSGRSSSIVDRWEAKHNNKQTTAEQKPFWNIREVVHLRVEARVALALNARWDVQTLPLGLMNGAREIEWQMLGGLCLIATLLQEVLINVLCLSL